MDKGTWLVRTKDLFISRPMSQNELVKKIEKGDLNPLDEVCPATGYWFGLHEVEEVRKHLGDIDLSKLSSGIEIEITSATETSTIKKTLILEMPKSWNPEQKSVVAPTYSLSDAAPAPSSPAPSAAIAPKRHTGRMPEEVERQWTPAVLFGAIFVIVLVFLWMHSD